VSSRKAVAFAAFASSFLLVAASARAADSLVALRCRYDTCTGKEGDFSATCTPPAENVEIAFDLGASRRTLLGFIRWLPVTITSDSFTWSLDLGPNRTSSAKINRSSWSITVTETESSERGKSTKTYEGSCGGLSVDQLRDRGILMGGAPR